MSREAKRILQKDPDERTEEEIKHVRSFAFVLCTTLIANLPALFSFETQHGKYQKMQNS